MTQRHEVFEYYVFRFSLLYTYAVSLVVVIFIFVVGKCLDLRRMFRKRQENIVNSRANYESLLRL